MRACVRALQHHGVRIEFDPSQQGSKSGPRRDVVIESVGNDANKYTCSSVGPQMLSLSSLSRIGHTFVHSFEARRAEASTDGGGAGPSRGSLPSD